MSAEPAAEALRAVSRLQGPYIGLQPYDEDDAAFFFGRSQESAIVAANLRSTKLTLLYGPSGVGKSSLLMAGVVHGLREHARAPAGDSPFAVCLFRSWHHEPLRGLQEACRAALQDLISEDALVAPVPGQVLRDTLRAWTTQAGALLIVLDQFEEYFQYYPDDGDAERLTGFAGELAGVVNDPNLAVHVLLSIREDAWASLDRFEGHIHSLFANFLRVDHLDRNAAREAIIQPIAVWNRMFLNGGQPYEIEQALVDAVIEAAAASAGLAAPSEPETAPQGTAGNRVEAPFLQLVLERLWRAAVEDGAHALTISRLDALGGPRQIVESHLSDALGRLTREEQNVASDCFTFLVSRSRTKVAHPGVDLAEWTKREESRTCDVLDKLCSGESGRILRRVATVSDDRQGPSYELYHDVLAEPVLAWRRRHQQKRERRRNLCIGGAAVALVVSSVVFATLGIRAIVQQQRADRVARAWLTVASTANDLTDTNLAQSLLLGLAANRAGATPQARSAMTLALEKARQSGVRALLTGHVGSVEGIAFSPNGRMLVSGGDDGTVRLWNLNTRTEVGAPMNGHSGAVHGVAFSPSGRTVASGGADGLVRLWSVRTHREFVRSSGARAGSITSVAYSADGKILASGNADGSVRLWTVPRLERFGQPLIGHQGPVTSVAFSPDGRTLASVGDDGTIRLWHAGMGGRLGAPLDCIDGIAYSVAFSRDGRLLACGGSGTVRLWGVHNRRPVGTLTSDLGEISSISFSADDGWVAGVGSDGTVRIWNVRSHHRMHLPVLGGNERILSVGFGPHGRRLAGAAFDGTIFVWDLNRRSPVAVQGTGDAYPITRQLLSPGGPTLAGAGSGGTVRLWSVDHKTTQGPTLPVEPGSPVVGMAFSGDGRILAGGSEDGTVRLWNVDSHEALDASPVNGDVGLLTSVALSPTGRMLAIAGDKGTRLREISGHPQVGPLLHGRRVASVGFSPDGRTLAISGYDGKVRLWAVNGSPSLRATLEIPGGPAYSIGFSPDGRTLATGDDDGTVRVWDVLQPRLRATLPGHGGPVLGIAFAPDGRVLASGGTDGTVRLWDTEGYGPLGTPLKHAGYVTSVTFSSDGRTLAASYPDGAILLWKGLLWRDDADLAAQVCGLVSHDLAVSEWSSLAPGLSYARQCSSRSH